MKNNFIHLPIDLSGCSQLPQSEKTRSGVEFFPQSMHWSFRDELTNVNMNFNLLPGMKDAFITNFKKVLVWYLVNRAPRTADNYFEHFLWLIKQINHDSKDKINQIFSHNIASVILLSESAERRIGHLSGFLKQWVNLEIPGIDKEVVELLEAYRPTQYQSGVAVATLDPLTGPLTDYEFESVQLALIKAFSDNTIDREQITLCYLLISLGIRPVQIASLKCCDFIKPEFPDGDYFLNIPRAKQYNQFARSSFKMRRLSNQIGRLLQKHVDGLTLEFSDLSQKMENFPIFPQRKRFDGEYAPGFEFHVTATTITTRVISCFSRLKIQSDRLPIALPLNAIRLRRTFATRASEEGWPLAVIAEMMDHSTTSTVAIYSAITQRIRANFSKKIAMDMAPIAMAFNGRIIESENQAKRPFESSRIIDLRIDQDGHAMGSCGSYSHCEFARPFACYSGCMDFEPWLDGPHEEALDFMLAKREALTKSADIKIASINDRAILGCAQIVLRCRELKNADNKNK